MRSSKCAPEYSGITLTASSNRRLDNKLNILEGIHKNYFFIVINMIMVGGQVMIIYVGGRAFNVVRLDPNQWGISIILGALSIPVGIIIRLIPDEFIGAILPKRLRKSLAPELLTQSQWDELEDGPHNLSFINTFKGGRIRHIRMKMKRRGSNSSGHIIRRGTGLSNAR